MDNTIFYLIGDTGAGRLAIAKEIAALTGARIVDSQAVYDPIFNLIEPHRPSQMPDEVWAQVDAVRAAILKTIETMSPKAWNFVFTHAGFAIPADIGVHHRVRDVAARRGARFQPVTLASRSSKPLLRFDEPHALDLDVTEMSPADAAKAIVAAAERTR
ncbi:MAG: hypothetical protein NUV72_11460 [Bauldia sp.]|jgi:hypothetical protein|nr:hypothetical protein [Bauldia sp.]